MAGLYVLCTNQTQFSVGEKIAFKHQKESIWVRIEQTSVELPGIYKVSFLQCTG